MESKTGAETRENLPAAERIGGDEVAGEERSGRDGNAGTGRPVRRPAPSRVARTIPADTVRLANFTGEQRLLLLDAWLRRTCTPR